MYKEMINNRLKLASKKKQAGVKVAKLTLASQDKPDLENMENYTENDHQETTEVPKSMPNIQLCSPRTFLPHSSNASTYQSTTNRQKSQSQVTIQPPKIQLNTIIKERQDYRLKVEQYKAKTEEYKSKIQTLTLENDSLRNRQKILQAQVNNCSQDYYERELSRLRGQCQKYQIQNMDLEHSLSSLRSQKSQVDTANKKRGDQIKNYIKQVQKEKMTIIEVKSQLNEKERTYRMVIEEAERSNELLQRNYTELTEKYSKLQNQLKEKSNANDSLSKQNEVLTNRFKESQAFVLATRKKYEQSLAQKQSKIISLNNSHQNTIRTLQQKILKLTNEVAGYKRQQSDNNIKINRMSLDIRSQQQQLAKQIKMQGIEEQNKQLRLVLQNKDKVIDHFQQKLKIYYSPQQYTNLQKKYRESEDKRLASAKYYQEKVYHLQKENQKWKLESINFTQNSNSAPFKPLEKEGNAFNEILKKNLQENTKIKEELRLKIQQSNELKSQILQIKLKQKKSMNDLQILTKKLEAQDKNIKIELQVQQQKYINEIDSLKRKLHTTQTRLQYKTNENKQKDDFIKNTIIGRSKPSDVPVILNELQRIFLQKQKSQLKHKQTKGEN